jgi:hypothetical protein
MLSLRPDCFIRPRIETCVKIVARFSPISRFGHRSASIGGTTLGSVRECRAPFGRPASRPDTMSAAQSQRSKATSRVEASYLKIA